MNLDDAWEAGYGQMKDHTLADLEGRMRAAFGDERLVAEALRGAAAALFAKAGRLEGCDDRGASMRELPRESCCRHGIAPASACTSCAKRPEWERAENIEAALDGRSSKPATYGGHRLPPGRREGTT